MKSVMKIKIFYYVHDGEERRACKRETTLTSLVEILFLDLRDHIFQSIHS